MERKLYRYRSFKDDWKEEAFDGIVEPSSPLYFNDPYDCGFCFQEDILSELLGKEDYIKALEKYIPFKKEYNDFAVSIEKLDKRTIIEKAKEFTPNEYHSNTENFIEKLKEKIGN